MKEAVYLRRPNIERELKKIFDKPLFIVSAPSGYGKTVSVSSFLKHQKAKTIWISCEPSDSLETIWQQLTARVAAYDEDLARQLHMLGCPNDIYRRCRIVDLFMSIAVDGPIVFVLDDYNNVKDSSIGVIISDIVKEAGNKNIHIVIITRDINNLDYWSFYNQHLVNLMTGNLLKFLPHEIIAYAQLIKVSLSEEDAQKIYNYTQGWFSLIYLMLRNIKQGIDINHDISVDELFNSTLFGGLSEKGKLMWLKLSLLDEFSLPMAMYVLNDSTLSNLPNQLFKDNAMLNYNTFTKTYSIHSLYGQFLRERAFSSDIDVKDVYSRAGQWCLKNDSFMSACNYLAKAGETEAILAEMNKEDMPDIKFVQFEQIYQIFENMTEDGLWKKYPIAFLQYLRMHLVSGNMRAKQKGERLLKSMEDYFLNADVDEHYRTFILGEIYILWPFVVFNDCKKMIMYNKIAEKYLQGNCSCIVTRKKEVTFGSPHFLYIYYREVGKLKETMELIVDNFFRFALVADGCGLGCDSLAQAEYSLETGDFNNVELYAYKAIYKAKSAEQMGTVICAVFAILRYTIYKASFAESKTLFDSLRHDVECESNPVLHTAFDMCNAYIECCLQDASALPKWIKEGNFDSGSFMFERVAFNYVVYEKCLLLLGEYLKLDAMCELFPNYNFQFKSQLGVLHNCIHEAIAKENIQGQGSGQRKLIEALGMGSVDNIILPFAENATYLLDMLYSIQEKRLFSDEEYLGKVIYHSEVYAQSLKQFKKSKEILTPREKEILILLSQGYTYPDIASKLYISMSTVRFHTRNIYDKLEVNNKLSMLRKARELNLISD